MIARNDMDLSIAMLMASAALRKISNKKPLTEEEIAAKDAENASRLEAVNKYEWEEMQRAPRAYYRRRAKMLSKVKEGR